MPAGPPSLRRSFRLRQDKPAFAPAIDPEVRRGRLRTERGDLIAAAALLLLAAGIGAIVFWQRMATTGDGILLFGDYDTADLSWYAAVASEASHTVPPTASYYSGHQLNAAYYAASRPGDGQPLLQRADPLDVLPIRMADV